MVVQTIVAASIGAIEVLGLSCGAGGVRHCSKGSASRLGLVCRGVVLVGGGGVTPSSKCLVVPGVQVLLDIAGGSG